MTSDKQTIAVYDSKFEDYRKAFAREDADPALQLFIDKLPRGAHVLDFGCGPGTHAAILRSHGFDVTATDASAGMIKLAKNHPGLNVKQAEFNDLDAIDAFDGVWANFSLLHAPRDAFPGHLQQIATALKQNGIFHIGMKTGSGERRDHLGRSYTFYQPNDLHQLLGKAGFVILSEKTGKSAGLAGTIDPWIVILSQLGR